MKYKVGDKVVIKSLDWYNINKNSKGKVGVPLEFNSDMSKYCGMLATITNVEKLMISLCQYYPDQKRIVNLNPQTLNEYRLDEDFFYNLNIDNENWNWTLEMFEDIKGLRKIKIKKINNESAL